MAHTQILVLKSWLNKLQEKRFEFPFNLFTQILVLKSWLNKLQEKRFEFPFNLFDKSTMAF